MADISQIAKDIVAEKDKNREAAHAALTAAPVAVAPVYVPPPPKAAITGPTLDYNPIAAMPNASRVVAIPPPYLPPPPPKAPADGLLPVPPPHAQPAASVDMAPANATTSRSSTSITSGVPLSPEAQALQAQAANETRSGIQKSADAAEAGNMLEADQARQQQRYLQKQQIESELDPVKLHMQREIDAEQQKYKDLQNEKINPHEFQDKQSPFQRIAWAVAMGLGGFAAGMKGGPNTAAELFQRSIQNNIDAQRENLANKKDISKTYLGYLQQRFATKEQQDAAAQIQGLQYFKLGLEAEAAKSKNAAVQANAQRELGAADAAIAENMQRGFAASANHVTRTFETVSAPSKGAAAQGAAMDKAGIPAFDANVSAITALMRRNGGELPGSGVGARAVKGLGHLTYGLIGGEQSNLLSSDARQAHGALFNIAEMMAHASGQRGLDAINANLAAIIGNGSNMDVQAGLARARAVVAARRASLQGAPEQTDEGDDAPEGFEDAGP